MATIPPKSFAVRFSQFVTQANTTAVNVPVIAGNTTVNSVVNATSIVVQSATSNVNLTANGLVVGTAVANGTTFSVGNSTVNATHTATAFQAAGPTSTVIVNNSIVAVGANVIANTTTVSVGNSTVNATHTATAFQAASIGSSATINSSAVAVGANVTVNTSLVVTGNSTVSSYLSAAVIKTGGTLLANGSNGTAGQVLTSGGSGNAYWSSTGGASLVANTTTAQTMYLPMSNATTGSWTNAVVDTGLTFVPSTRTLTSPVVVANVAQINVGNITTGNVSGSISFGSGASNIVINSTAISISGSIGNSGQVLSSTGTGLAWANAAAGGGGGGSGTTTNALEFGVGLANGSDGDVVWYKQPAGGGADRLGTGVATNGTYTAVAASQYNSAKGAVYIYSNATGALLYTISNVGSFSQQLGTGRPGMVMFGNYLAVSAVDNAYGKVFLFNMSNWAAYSGSTISITSATVTISNPASTYVDFGRAIAMNSSLIAISAPNATSGGYSSAGIVYMYDLSGTLKHTINDPNAYSFSASDNFGYSLALSSTQLVAGAPGESDSSNSSTGKVYVFNLGTFSASQTITSSNYTSYGYVINNPDSASQAPSMGSSVAIVSGRVFAGAPNRTFSDASGTNNFAGGSSETKYYVGAVYAFDSSNGTYLGKINTPNPLSNEGQYFGVAMAASDGNVLIGEPNWDVQWTKLSGVAYLYDALTLQIKKVYDDFNLIGPDSTITKSGFGSVMAMANNFAVFGAANEQAYDNAGNNTGIVYLVNTRRTFDGSSALTVSLAKTSVQPGIYGYTDGNTVIQVPQMVVDKYGRVTSITSMAYTAPSSGITSAFQSLKVGQNFYESTNNPLLEIAAGNNVTLSSTQNNGTTTVTISATGGSSGGGGGGGAITAGDYFFRKYGMNTAITVTSSTNAVTTTPNAPGRLLIRPPQVYVPGGGWPPPSITGASIQGQGPMDTITGPYSGSYGSTGTVYPFISIATISSSTGIAFSIDQSITGQVIAAGWVLESSTNPSTETLARYGSGGSAYSSPASVYMQNAPAYNYSLYWSNPGWAYGIMFPGYGGGGPPIDLSTFVPSQGVTAYHDTDANAIFFKCPGSIWSVDGQLGQFVNNTGGSSYYMEVYYFGS